MEELLIDIAASPVADVLDVLLQDKTTKKNIIWATDAYAEYGEAFADTAPMDAAALLRRPGIIRPRIRKTQEEQARRTRTKAEVYTPAWLCNRMNNDCDADWFGRPGVFNAENAGVSRNVNLQSGNANSLWESNFNGFYFIKRAKIAFTPKSVERIVDWI